MEERGGGGRARMEGEVRIKEGSKGMRRRWTCQRHALTQVSLY